MAICMGYGDFGKEVCKALGLEAQEVHSLHISINARDVVMVNVEMYLKSDDAPGLIEVFKKYELHEKEEPTKLNTINPWNEPK